VRNFLRRIRLMLHLAKNDDGSSGRHHGHDVAQTIQAASHTVPNHSSAATNNSRVDSHVAGGASNYAKSFKKRR